MITVRVELHSAITGEISEIARMRITNRGDSSDPELGSYDIATLTGRTSKALDAGTVNRRGMVIGHRRLRLHVWHLIYRALTSVGYVGS